MRALNKFIPFLMIALLSACVGGSGVSSKRSLGSSNTITPDKNGGEGVGSLPGDGSIGSGGGSSSGKVELRHIVDPFDGTYKTKVTIPKNFTGLLYLSGLNITSLSDKHVFVRFNFGREKDPVIIEGTIGRGEGITPQTNTEVIILDMEDRPFENVRLLYDLFDYNDYRDGVGAETLDPTQDPRNGGLYCRGLKIEDDPTFQGSTTNTACDAVGEKCHYAYAKIIDSGLYTAANVPYLPTEAQLDVGGGGYASESVANTLKKCLPDNNSLANLNAALNTALGVGPTMGQTITLSATNYTYNGPFRPAAESSWQISGGALFSTVNLATEGTGLFQSSLNALSSGGYTSFLFPRAGKMDLSLGVQHLSSSTPFGTRALTTMAADGETEWMDGCNIRAVNRDTSTGEGIASCNVSATIEILTKDPVTQELSVLAGSSTHQVKLQLIRSSQTDYEGKEVLYTSLKTCSSSHSCGSDECCFNNRCWSKEIVSQCAEDSPTVGNNPVGAVCTSDFECSSLCCNQGTSTCGVHVNTEQNTVLCSKSPGQTCVAKEWCMKENVPNCFIVKTSISQQGQQLCALRCYNIPTHGDCINGLCTPPTAPDVPTFDPLNPQCSNYSEVYDPNDIQF